jgi:signal transduction histidine kinase
MAKLWAVLGVLAAAALVTLLYLESHQTGRHISLPYIYEDTRQVVLLVESAANLVEEQGTKAFPKFAVPGSKWFNETHYLFIYDIDGTSVFHPVIPELVGKNLMNLKDMNGKPVIREITDIGHLPGPRASGWVFYLWEGRAGLTPSWKISYIRKAVGPGGRIYLVGSGSHKLKIEPVFVRNNVDRAAELLKSQGKEAAFAQFRDRASPFSFCGTYIYVFNTRGDCLVDPAFPSQEKRNMLQFQDALGHYVVKDMLKLMENQDQARVQYMASPKPGTTLPTRKLAFLRKVTVNGESLIIMSDFSLATPIWMQH